MKTILAATLLLCASTAFAAPKPCTPSCKPRAHAKHCDTLWESFVSNLELVGGFRWEEEHLCPAARITQPTHPPHKDPAFVGAQVRLPLAERVGIGGGVERDLTEQSRWQGRIYLSVTPWNK